MRDFWGQPVLQVQPGAERFLSPVRRSAEIDVLATREMVRLQIVPGSPRRQLGGIELTDDEYERYVEDAGQRAYEKVSLFVERPGYDMLLDETKAEKLHDLFLQARKEARALIRPEVQMRGLTIPPPIRTFALPPSLEAR